MHAMKTRLRLAMAALAALAAAGTVDATALVSIKTTVGQWMYAGDRPLTAAMFACVHDLVQQGLPLALAIGECHQRLQALAQVHGKPFGAGLDAHGITFSGWATSPGIRATCASVANPLLAGGQRDGGTPPAGDAQFSITGLVILERQSADGGVVREV